MKLSGQRVKAIRCWADDLMIDLMVSAVVT